jgi:tetratricopeptide (TPR) repeat protein
MVLSKVFEARGELDEAVTRAEMALALEPFSWRLHQRRGIVMIRAERFEEAVRSLDRACKLGRSQEACANLANALQKGGQLAEAREAAEYAASLIPTGWGEYNLACYHALAGMPARAIDDLRRSIELGFADALINTDLDLESLRGRPEFEELVDAVAERIRLRRELSTSVFPWQAHLLLEHYLIAA